MQRRLKVATLWVPGARNSASASNTASERLPGSFSSFGVRLMDLADGPFVNVYGDRQGGRRTKSGKARPVVDVDEDRLVGSRHHGVAAEDVETQRGGRAEGHPAQAGGVHLGAVAA